MPSVTTTCPQCALVYVGGEIFCPGDGARLVETEQPSRSHSEAPRDPLIGTLQSERYRIVRRIGEGGMGIVYEAEHVVIEKRVALKVLREDFSRGRPDVVERFRQEAKSASRIGHENIIDISDFGMTDGGAHFFVMELLQGHDLASELEKQGLPSTERTLRIVITCARALGAAHEKGIVHRDMKPENIFLCTRARGEDFVKIVDFGIAKMNDADGPGSSGPKLTKTGMIFGTPEYMSPEQASGKTLDHRVDVYALGVILYELLTGRVPFVGDTFMGILTSHAIEPVPPMHSVNPRCTASPELEAIVMRAMAKSPAERFASMEELARALEVFTPRVGASLTPGAPSVIPLPGTVTHYGSQPPLSTVSPLPRQLLSDPPQITLPQGARGVPKRALIWAGAGALGAALLVAAVVVNVNRNSASGTAQAPVAVQPGLPARPAAANVVPTPPVLAVGPKAPQPENPPAAALVAVTVELDPPTATLTADGVQVCAGVPCSLSFVPGTRVEFLGSAAGHKPTPLSVQVLPTGQTVKLKLKRRASGPRQDSELMQVPQLNDAFGR